MKKILLVLLLSFLLSFLTLYFPKPINAALPTFTWQVTDQNGTPLENALVWVYWKGQYFSWCNTNSSGRCSVTLSCATPCELSGDVEYQSYTGSYSGFYDDGALIEVVINIPAPSPTPSPPPYPTPSPYPSPTPTPPPPPGYACGLSAGERVSRPDACTLCNLTGLFCPSCATSFTVFDEVKWQWKERDLVCEGKGNPDWKITPWGGTIIIDPTQTTIPFVGHKGGEDEKLYLADYFEGTNEYYENYGKYWLDWVNYAGVWRKLSPMEYQNQLKKEMVQRAINSYSQPGQEGAIHDYKLNYIGRLCWDLPFLGDAFLALAQRHGIGGSAVRYIADHAHHCLFSSLSLNPLDDALIAAVHAVIETFNNVVPAPLEISHRLTNGVRSSLSGLAGHEPPEPDEEDYIDKWNAWKESEWGRLWAVAPMVSREDTPGEIIPYLGSKPQDTFIINNPEALVEKVPHVARLYEATQIVKNILTPHVGGEEETSSNKTEPIIASAKENVLGEKALLAQGPGCVPCGCKYYFGDSINDCSCMNRKKPDGEPECRAEHPGGDGCPIKKHWRIYGTICGWSDCKPTERGCHPHDKLCCGGFVNPSPPPDIPVCGLPDPLPVYHCEQPAITDSNPKDDLCCDPINIILEAVDMFNDYPYTPCVYGCDCCDPPKPEGCVLPCLCNPECNTWEYRTVNREIGINLLHPYLTEIWEQTGKTDTAGLFNSFRPATYPEFQEIDASSEILYSQIGFDSIEPSTGKFYYNYLGGVQLAKDWLIRTLTPRVE